MPTMYEYSLMFYDRFEECWEHSRKFPKAFASSVEDYLSILKDYTIISAQGKRAFLSNGVVNYKVVVLKDNQWRSTLREDTLAVLLKTVSNIATIET